MYVRTYVELERGKERMQVQDYWGFAQVIDYGMDPLQGAQWNFLHDLRQAAQSLYAWRLF